MAASRIALVGALLGSCALAQNCTAPPPAKNFDQGQMEGQWFEIARIQTAGGNALQQFCACTELVFSPSSLPAPYNSPHDHDVLNSCRFLEPTGFFVNATSYLTNNSADGSAHWNEVYCTEGCPPASYNFIIAGQDKRGVDYAVEYDCSNNPIFGDNYCLHYLSREPLGFDQVLLDELVLQTTVIMGLNPQNRVLNVTTQEGCW